MTDNKPLITYSGEIPVFQSVVPALQKGIGAEAVEWKRAYGRSTKHVHLHPRFVPFDPPQETHGGGDGALSSLLDQAMLHTFWTDCSDVEVYRATTKDVIQSWLNSVKSCNVKEWLIILVEPSDNKKSNKLLPRSSVLDKIKNDFAQKQTERCVCVSDPLKIDSKSTESLNSMLHRIRQLLLASYSKTLTKFEENMRAQREKRIESGWNFCHYFLLQEELAFVLEILEVYDEALVQYDELDALFTQFVLNSHFTDTPKWLLSFQRFGDRWPSLPLSPSSGGNVVLEKIRETIKNSTVSLLNFRNYLFARQAILLVKQNRLPELAQRSLAFLHICINELNILDVNFIEEGAISCWVFVSCLEILGTISGQSQNPQISGAIAVNDQSEKSENITNATDTDQHVATTAEVVGKHSKIKTSASSLDFSVHTASLWDYAREKLYELGKLCGLLPKNQLKSDHLHKVISLAAGLSPFDEYTNSNGNGGSHVFEPHGETPIEKLKNALSSKEKFQENYLELCELAMGTYKHIKRLRSARKVGLSLASYYIEAEEFNKAVGFLTDAFHTFKDDKWAILTVHCCYKLAQCYQAINDTERYIRTCAYLACSKAVDQDQRNHYFDEMMSSLSKIENNDRIIVSPTDETFSISSLFLETTGNINGSWCDVQVELELVSNLPRSITSNIMSMAILPCDHVPRQINYSTAGTFVQGESNKSKQGKQLNKRSSGDNMPANRRKESSEINSGHDVENLAGKDRVERKESVTPALTCEEEDIALANLEMTPTLMRVEMSQELEKGNSSTKVLEGNAIKVNDKEKFLSGKLMCHSSHAPLRRKDSSQVPEVSKTDFSEDAKTNDITINPGANKIKLFAKISKPGSYRLAQVSILIKNFELLSPRFGCRYRFTVRKEPPTMQIQAGNLVAGIEQLVSIILSTGSFKIEDDAHLLVRSSHGMRLKRSELEESSFCSEMSLTVPQTEPFSSVSVKIIVKADLGTQKDSPLGDHKLMIKCPWTTEEKKLSLSFIPPFVCSHKIHSVGQRKFVQVILTGNSDTGFIIMEHQLKIQSTNSQDIPLVPLNPRSQSLVLDTGKSASYMWEIGVLELNDEQPLRLEFLTKFKAKDTELEVFKYYICLQKFKSQYELKSKVEPHKGTEFCRVGNMCSMMIEICKTISPKDSESSQSLGKSNSLMYEVRADQHLWAICGRSSGVVSFENDNETLQQVSLDVMAMSPGFLPLPTVHLSKYIPADQKSGTSNVPKLEPFNTGQVFNRSKGSQVHVLPPPQTVGSTGGLSGGSSSIGSSLTSAIDNHF